MSHHGEGAVCLLLYLRNHVAVCRSLDQDCLVAAAKQLGGQAGKPFRGPALPGSPCAGVQKRGAGDAQLVEVATGTSALFLAQG